MSTGLLPASVTPERLAEAYGELVLRPRAQLVAGRDQRVGPEEQAGDPFVADAYSAKGAHRPTVNGVVDAGKARMVEAAKAAAGPDHRVSAADADKMPQVLARAFHLLRAGKVEDPAATLASAKTAIETEADESRRLGWGIRHLESYDPALLAGQAQVDFAQMQERESDLIEAPQAHLASGLVVVTQFTHDSFGVGIYTPTGLRLARGDGWGSPAAIDWEPQR